jgi:hypothetical protein
MPLRLAKLEALLAGLSTRPDKAHTLGRCRLEPCSGRLGIFREVRGGGLPVAELLPGERMLWDNRFRIELGAKEHAPVLVRALGEAGLRELKGRSPLASSLPLLAGRTLPSCWRGEVLVGLPNLAPATGGDVPGLDCRAIFVSALKVEKARERQPAQAVEKTCTSLG